MPVALPLAELALIGLILIVYLWLVANRILLLAAVHALADHVPIVGKYIARAVETIVRYALEIPATWLYAQAHSLIGWFLHYAAVFEDWIVEAARFAEGVAIHFAHLVGTKIPELVGVHTQDIAKDAGKAKANAATALGKLADEQLAREQGIDKLRRDLRAEFTKDLQNGIDRLKKDIPGQVETEVAKDVAAGGFAAGSDVARLGERVTGLEKGVGSLDLQKLLGLLATGTATAALVDVIAREAGLDKSECRSKVKSICTTPWQSWLNLLGGLALIDAWPGLNGLTRETAAVFDEAKHFIRATIEG